MKAKWVVVLVHIKRCTNILNDRAGTHPLSALRVYLLRVSLFDVPTLILAK